MPDLNRLRAAYEQAKAELLAERTENGHWVGELSSSALSTATAVSALAVVRRVQSPKSKVQRQGVGSDSTLDLGPWTLDSLITRGASYLVTQQNPDGGFGDTDLSHSNIATTYLVVAALHLAGVIGEHAELLARANAYLDAQGRLAGLRKRYGIDKTFVVPIMTNLALAGLLDWREIDPLPFELACAPQSLYRFVGMPVVSYAIPALVAIGQARYHHAPPWNPITRLVRWLSISRSLAVLRRMQPDSGGYLEATPLTSFVVMSLASSPPLRGGISATESRATVIREGIKFLANSIRPDGSWPIDTNLATWNTTLAINALAGAGENIGELLDSPFNAAAKSTSDDGAVQSITAAGHLTPPKASASGNVLDWLLSCQHHERQPFTGADPGGFGWSKLTGAVPDADDTPGAIIAMRAFTNCRHSSDERREYARVVGPFYAYRWLFSLQNRDGGWPTFCRGWGKLPFDRSGTDITAHALRAFEACGIPNSVQKKRALTFLRRRQHPDGSWSPLWFGNQDHPTEDNPVYGTAKVLLAYRDLGLMDSPEAQRGVVWLVANQNADGGWGSGVWERSQSAKLRVPGGVESGDAVTGPGGSGHTVLGTQYSVLSTQFDRAMSPPSPQPLAPGPLTSSIEETALAVEALLAAFPRNATEGVPYNPEPRTLNPEPSTAATEKGLNWLIERVERGEHRQPAPIGFYFAKLWYYERLYPLTFTVAALGRALRKYSAPIAHPTEFGTDRQTQPAGSP